MHVPGRRLSAHDVHVHLAERPVLHGVSLTAHPGQILALVGPNGCGKSTLLSVLSGVRHPRSGTVRLDDEHLHSIPVRELARHRALVTQQNRVDTPFTVREVVELGRYPWLRTPEAARTAEIVRAAVASCGIADLVDRQFPQLSGGQQARVSLARALAQDTPVLLLDEPTAALDIGHTEQTLRILRRRADAGTTIILVVHDLSLAAAYADQVALMKEGRLLATGTVDEVMTAELLSATYDHPVSLVRHPDTGELIVTPDRS
ncbi:heme ABC transporter ATP-binding protein [Gordonia iterans]|uniref:Heme ABC transporter ATP-binding protein n=1 Tax=Gordonia iterans TaxID=1004901 RepID=A0A2S0KFE3_9ACTN|nr:heme ABC transporter ATP-binding protein [Gordonia iterans]AVM00410.1 heme ABC transporter ATP-binding protein [Gordonia iterans]